jgi:5-methylcytosine-specific restriction protein B
VIRAQEDIEENGEEGASPWFIILDEMNLSHVERYFCDFLAHMESREQEMRLHHEEKCVMVTFEGGSSEVVEVRPAMKLPPNLFLVGTVNVDETTYMFSPKVLDRANVIEFRITEKALENAEGKSPVEEAFKSNESSPAFLDLSMRARAGTLPTPGSLSNGQETSDSDSWSAYKKAIIQVFQILQRCELEFGYRTQKEISAYALVDFFLHVSAGGPGHPTNNPIAPWDWRQCFDEQLMQKVLPKLHGDQTKLNAILSALLRYCAEEKDAFIHSKIEADKKRDFFAPSPTFDKLQELDSASPDPATIRFPLSYAKLCRMKRTIERDQFVSYIA